MCFCNIINKILNSDKQLLIPCYVNLHRAKILCIFIFVDTYSCDPFSAIVEHGKQQMSVCSKAIAPLSPFNGT